MQQSIYVLVIPFILYIRRWIWTSHSRNFNLRFVDLTGTFLLLNLLLKLTVWWWYLDAVDWWGRRLLWIFRKFSSLFKIQELFYNCFYWNATEIIIVFEWNIKQIKTHWYRFNNKCPWLIYYDYNAITIWFY